LGSAGVAQDQDSVLLSEKVNALRQEFDAAQEIQAETKSTVDLLKKIKLSGYIQSQFQSSDWAGGSNGVPVSGQSAIGNFSGGAFPLNVASRFSVRRGRFKIAYENEQTVSQYVLQFDVTQNGLGIKDAYITVKDPWRKIIGLTMGVFDRPFGFEVSYSSNMRETPERSRMAQTLFPGEREIGAKLEFQPETGDWTWLNAKVGVFNGVLPTANENDNRKDIIGRVGFILPYEEQNIALDGGVSFYNGTVQSNSKFITTTTSIDSTTTNAGKNVERSYLGVDGQFVWDMPALGGLSVRGEYIFGKQPGTSSTNSFYNPGTAVTSLYARNFSGYYISVVQNIGTQYQMLLRYDVFDPNTDAAGSDIGLAGKNLSIGDIRYSTLGLGAVYHWDENVKFTLYYDMVSNETVNAAVAATSALAPFKNDVKDNVLTFRIQCKIPH
jgi:phosphate-selective porin